MRNKTMSTQSHYDTWSTQYDTNANKTRDLEAICLQQLLEPIHFRKVLEIGAGTGKNTLWFLTFADLVTAVDLSAEMLAIAKTKVAALVQNDCEIAFIQADITQPWTYGEAQYDLVSFSLMLEHIAELDPVFAEVTKALVPGGHVYIGELHPFKQYLGSKAKYITDAGEVVVDCYNHHISDFVGAAQRNGLQVVTIEEFFDDNDRSGVPRILGMVLRKP
jgi:ubiquinone/menaquinone biosynthesis C-methylase UbiE